MITSTEKLPIKFKNKTINCFRSPEIITKGWGAEHYIVNDKYCGKLLVYRKGGKSSSHYHLEKDETFYCLSGVYKLTILNPTDATKIEQTMQVGDIFDIPAGLCHQLECIEAGTIIEFSTLDKKEDSLRVGAGDSQK